MLLEPFGDLPHMGARPVATWRSSSRKVPGALLRQHRPGEGEARRLPAHGEAAAAQRHLRNAR
eukprot:3290961-Prymnesium_polylepis.1